ncbi:MAG: PHP domain-containing protein [Phycisphaerales bacterium]|nr:PHP domain-containing protein [Phycisphaerales bacterium]MCB9862258.1 PHP domain-containing protein [Phycisphaerales bacterium]
MTLNLLFHVHTHASFDSMMSPHTILRYCRDNDIHAVAVCDHDSIRGSVEAQEAAGDYGVIVIPAVEISTDAGDIVGLFVNRLPGTNRIRSVLSFIRDECHGLAVLPHAARGHDLDRIPLDQIDIVETGNARCSSEDNQFAKSLAEDLGKPAIVGADAHVAGELANALNTFEIDAPAVSDNAQTSAALQVDAVAVQLRDALLTAPRRFQLQRSPVRYAAISRVIKGVKRRQPTTILRACRTLLREEAHRRLWRFNGKAASK